MEKAVLDRIVDGKHAVLLVGEIETEKIISSSDLPEGAVEGTWLQVEFNEEELVYIEIDKEETEKRQVRIKGKMELLRERSKRKDR